VGKEGESGTLMSHWLASAGVKPEYAVTGADGKPVTGVETHVFRNGAVIFVALMTNPQLRVDELGPPEFRSNDRFAKEMPVTLTLPGQRYVYDIRAGKSLGAQSKLILKVPPYDPVILAVTPVAFSDLTISAPEQSARGESFDVGVRFAKGSIAGLHAMHIELTNPAGKVVDGYSGNLIARNGEATHHVPLALNDVPGRWEVRVRDVISGQVKSAMVEVH
jgi:hypothetical protein